MHDECKKLEQPGQQADEPACRRTARSALVYRIEELRRQAEQLEHLSNALPMQLGAEADEALWRLIISSRAFSP